MCAVLDEFKKIEPLDENPWLDFYYDDNNLMIHHRTLGYNIAFYSVNATTISKFMYLYDKLYYEEVAPEDMCEGFKNYSKFLLGLILKFGHNPNIRFELGLHDKVTDLHITIISNEDNFEKLYLNIYSEQLKRNVAVFVRQRHHDDEYPGMVGHSNIEKTVNEILDQL